jgi:dihydrodipicolinate synthase/N-acetylneuraminate lyase
MLTPRRPGTASPDTGALLEYVDTLARAGVDGLVLFGAIGEFVHFDTTDRMHALKMAIRRSRVPVLANASHSTLDGAIALAADAFDCGAAGILLLPPCFYPYTDEQVIEFYVRFRENVPGDMPVYVYNHPFCANRLSEGVAEQLLATGEFAGAIDASEDGRVFVSLFRTNRVLIGSARAYLKAREGGAAGCVSPLAAAIPELVVALERSIRSQSESHALLLNGYLQEFCDQADRLPPLIGIMTAAAARGWNVTESPVPLDMGTRREQDGFGEWLRNWLPPVLKDCAGA